jgi:hypothetical protein
MVVTSEFITTLAVTSRKMEVNQEQAESQAVKDHFTSIVDVPAARSSYAKEGEHLSSGRSPGSWLQTLLSSPSRSIVEQWLAPDITRERVAHQLQ